MKGGSDMNELQELQQLIIDKIITLTDDQFKLLLEQLKELEK